MTTGKHVALSKLKDHKNEKGCVNKHEVAFDKPTYPNCAYKPNGYNAILSESVKGTATSKRSLYEYDFTQTHPEGTSIDKNPRARLPPQMQTFSSTGRQPKAEKELGLPRKVHRNTDPRQNARAWHLEGQNYKVGHLPFGHEYHHIMPEEAISEALKEKEAEVLQAAGYNINAGKNIIILPITQDAAFALMLPKHKGWHRAYNQSCINLLTSYKQLLSETKEEHEITPDNVDGVRTNIETWEDNTYGVLVNVGRKTAVAQKAAAKINNIFKT
ncbi:hypothetical protein D7V97_20895 [Corallococcus sp. CA053C]|uniref:AHH domain-containing protein n=1 Tax=Corallococcus sp. CA053C TaxID=2316732 RepID=UPI000EA015A1|nr:AHH domain-containing protein [Corallococcus sp. CA053C]RKH07963.1 hypothetical protein D7V97_20895 [Corallococcus sp. CA053C]